MLNIMKRITLFFMLAAFSPFVSQAQYSHLYYHCQRDTIIGDAEIYYHSCPATPPASTTSSSPPPKASPPNKSSRNNAANGSHIINTLDCRLTFV